MKICSVNCRGLSSDPVKRRKNFEKYKKYLRYHFLIDTHSKTEIEKKWKSEWGYEAWFNSYTSMSRGVAILFNNTFNYKLLSITKDRTGNTIMLDIKITSSNKKLTLVAVYGPNETNCELYNFYQSNFFFVKIHL